MRGRGGDRCDEPARLARTASRRRTRMRALDAWAIAQLGMPSLELMERAGAGACRTSRPRCARRDGSRSFAARATTAATASSPRACCATRAARSTCCRLRQSPSSPVTRALNPERLPGDPPEPLDSSAIATGRAQSSTRCLGTGFAGVPREQRRGHRGDRRRCRGRAASVLACDIPSGVDAIDAGGRRARPCGRERPRRFTPRSPACGSSPGKGHAGRVDGDRHRHPRRCPGCMPSRADRRRGHSPRSLAAACDSTKFTAGACWSPAARRA